MAFKFIGKSLLDGRAIAEPIATIHTSAAALLKQGMCLAKGGRWIRWDSSADE